MLLVGKKQKNMRSLLLISIFFFLFIVFDSKSQNNTTNNSDLDFKTTRLDNNVNFNYINPIVENLIRLMNIDLSETKKILLNNRFISKSDKFISGDQLDGTYVEIDFPSYGQLTYYHMGSYKIFYDLEKQLEPFYRETNQDGVRIYVLGYSEFKYSFQIRKTGYSNLLVITRRPK